MGTCAAEILPGPLRIGLKEHSEQVLRARASFPCREGQDFNFFNPCNIASVRTWRIRLRQIRRSAIHLGFSGQQLAHSHSASPVAIREMHRS